MLDHDHADPVLTALPDGSARVANLPQKGKPLTYEISHQGRKATVEQNLETTCQGTFEVSLK